MEAIIGLIYLAVLAFNIMLLCKFWKMCNDVHTIMKHITKGAQPTDANTDGGHTDGEHTDGEQCKQEDSSLGQFVGYCALAIMVVIIVMFILMLCTQ